MKISRTLLALAFVLGGSSLTRTSSAADLVIEPRSSTVAHCREVAVRIVLRNVEPETALSGYQLYLCYYGQALTPLRYEGTSMSRTLYSAGVEPFGTGFSDCDEWQDGLAHDVVAIGGTIYPDNENDGVEELATDGDIELGIMYFEVSTGVFGDTMVEFTAEVDSCRDFFDESTSVFDLDGAKIDLTLEEMVPVTLSHAGDPVSDLACAFDETQSVDLSWTLPSSSGVEGFRILRDGELLAELAADATSYRDEGAGGSDSVEYEVAPIVEGGTVGCPATCTAVSQGVAFIRGDVNFDGGFNITDAVLVLSFLFSGGSLSCEDAADIDDDGSVLVTDPVYGLDFFFNSGPLIPPPVGEPGLDPTEDDLGCALP